MGQIIPKLNLNKTPQLVDNNSLIFAKNIKLLKDGTISRDDAFSNISLNLKDITAYLDTCINEYNTIYEEANAIVNQIRSDVNELNTDNTNYDPTKLGYYIERRDTYRRLSIDYTTLYDIYNYEEEDPDHYSENDKTVKVLGYIEYNTSFYLFVEITWDDNIKYNILEYSESNGQFKPINCNWNWSGGEIYGNAVTNLNGDIILNIGEYNDSDESVTIPFKSININKSSIQDDESIYTQTPAVELINLSLKGYYTTPIPNGVYQFFVRYLIKDNFYTAWYPASRELFSGSRDGKRTNQGGLSFIDTKYDNSRSFILHVDKAVDSPINFDKFQLGFIISHDAEVYARAYKHYSLKDTTDIYFDYDENYIREIEIKDLIESNFQLYNVHHITEFRNKLYVADYKETDFNPVLHDYADKVNVAINTKVFAQNTDDINSYSITKDGSGNVITIDNQSILSIVKNLFTQASSFIKTDKAETKVFSNYGINLEITKTLETSKDHEYSFGTHDENINKGWSWDVNLIDDGSGIPYETATYSDNDLTTYLNGKPLHLTSEDNGKFFCLKDTFDNAITNEITSHRIKHGYTFEDMCGALYMGIEYLIKGSGVDDPAGVDTRLFDDRGVSFYIDANTKELKDNNALTFKRFWYLNSYNKHTYEGKPSTLNDDAETTVNTYIYNSQFNYSGDSYDYGNRNYEERFYSEKLYRIDFNISFTKSYYDKFNTDGLTDADINATRNVYIENVNNITTLLPLQIYKFYIHYVSKYGEITNGYQIGNINGIEIGNYAPGTLIYPSFSNIVYPKGYVACFISIQHYKNKVTTIFDIKSLELTDESTIICGDCIDLDTRLVSSIINLPVYSGGELTTNAHYHPSFDSKYLELFGANGKVILDSAVTGDYAYIKLDYTNDSDDTLLTKCTPFITEDSYSEFNDLNLLGYIGLIKKPKGDLINNLENTKQYYADTDVYSKDISSGSVTLDDNLNSANWGTYFDSDFYYVYSNYNVNFLSLTLDVIPKVKMDEDELTGINIAAIICINSIQLSDIYELQSMYKSYTKRQYLKYTNSNQVTFKNTVRSTQLEGDEATVNIYRFQSGDYYNIPSNKGIITNLVTIGEVILVHTKDSLFKFSGNNTLTAQGGEDVVLKESSPFETGITEMFGSQLGYGGLQDKHNSIATQAGYFFYDKDCNIIYGYTGEGKLGELSSPIEKIMYWHKIKNIDFACDFYNDRLFINIQYEDDFGFITLSYNFRSSSFVSLHDFDYDYSINTKDKCYFIKENPEEYYVATVKINDFTSEFVEVDQYLNFYKEDKLFPFLKNHAIVDVIYNEYYQQTKVIESIQWICKKVVDYGLEEWNFNTIMYPLMAEEPSVPYSGEQLRLYSDSASSDLLEINDRSNDYKLSAKESYKVPRYNLGFYSFNYFRNILNIKKEPGYKEDGIPVPIDSNYLGSDNQSLIYGKYFVARFILDNEVNFKLENVTFITTPYK